MKVRQSVVVQTRRSDGFPESVSVETKKKHIEFLKSLKIIILTSNVVLYVHAFTNVNGVDYEYSLRLLGQNPWETALA
jgi:serine/threonine protein phosphatase 1